MFESWDPLFQQSKLEEETSLLSQPISSRLTMQYRHLTPYVGHLVLGNQLMQLVIAGVPPLPYQTEEHPLVLKLFQKNKDQWLELQSIPELRLAVRNEHGRFLQPVALNHQQGSQEASLELRYGEAQSWQQEALILSLKIHANSNRLEAHWRYQNPLGADKAKVTQLAKRHQIRVRTQLEAQQSLSFKKDPGSIQVLHQGLETLAVVHQGDWQWQSQDGSTRFFSTTDQDQAQPLQMHFLVGRFGLMEIPVSYSPLPRCAFAQNELPRVCIEKPNQRALQNVQVRLSARKHPGPYYGFVPLLHIAMPGMTEALQIPALYGELLNLHLPPGSRLAWNMPPDKSAAKVLPNKSREDQAEAPPSIFSFHDEREFADFPLQKLKEGEDEKEYFLSLRSLLGSQALVHFPANATQAADLRVLGPSALLALKDQGENLKLEAGSYQLNLFHQLGPICHQELLVEKKKAVNFSACLEAKPWRNAVKVLQARAANWSPILAGSPHSQAVENPLELIEDPAASDSKIKIFWFYDPNFDMVLRIRQPSKEGDLKTAWQDFRKSDRSLSVFLFKQFLAEHAPQASLEMSCPLHPVNVHDYESLAKSLRAEAFDVLGCHDLSYEDQLFQAVDRLQGIHDHSFQIHSITAYPDSISRRLAIPAYYQLAPKRGNESQALKTVGAGAAVQILGHRPESQGQNRQAQRLSVQVQAEVFSLKYSDLKIRFIAMRKDGATGTIAELDLPVNEGANRSPVRDISLELPAGCSYLRAEILGRAPSVANDQRIRLATSQYWPLMSTQ